MYLFMCFQRCVCEGIFIGLMAKQHKNKQAYA